MKVQQHGPAESYTEFSWYLKKEIDSQRHSVGQCTVSVLSTTTTLFESCARAPHAIHNTFDTEYL